MLPNFPDTLALERLFDVAIDLAAPLSLGATPLGQRTIFAIAGGSFDGPRARGRVHAGGGDWLLTLPNGAGELDVRATLETDDGALIYMTYRGVLDASPEVIGRIFSGEDVGPDAYYFRTAPRFETGSAPYAWLNKRVCVGAGWFAPGKVGYRVFGVE
jgi:hypothetical protein